MKNLLILSCIALVTTAAAPEQPDLLIDGPKRFIGEATVTMTTPCHDAIHYTLDGSPPTADSQTYAGPFTVKDSVTVKALVIDQSGNPVVPTVFKTLTRLVVKPLPLGQWVKAADAVEMNGPRFDAKKENIGWCNNGGNILFGPFLLSPGINRTMEATVGVAAGGKMHVRLDAADGPIVGTFVFQSTGGFASFATQRAPVKDLSGQHMLYFVFEGGNGICNFKQFQFTSP